VRFHACQTLPVSVQAIERGPKLVANQEHLDLLRQGVDVWNAWRKSQRTRVSVENENGDIKRREKSNAIVQVRVIKDAFSKEQKRQIISKS
jgi:hypothetical protein